MSRALLFPLGGGGSSTQATTKKLAFFRSGSSSLSFKAFHSFNCKRNLIFPPISTSFSCRLSTAGDKQEDQVAVSSSSSNNNNNNKLLHRNINNINNDLLDNTGHEQQYTRTNCHINSTQIISNQRVGPDCCAKRRTHSIDWQFQ
jgi:hypothetical protein